jgi:hypothetical protein
VTGQVALGAARLFGLILGPASRGAQSATKPILAGNPDVCGCSTRQRGRGGERCESNYWIRLEATPQPFGGRRWWFVCPRVGRRTTKLYLPDGELTFASRQAYRLADACQREQPHHRAWRRACKLRGKLGGNGGLESDIPKPKWMRQATYDRKLERIFAVEELVYDHIKILDRKVARLLGR